jgi:hypothetical protein
MAATSTSPDLKFTELMDGVREHCEKIADYVADGTGQRPWMIPPKGDWDGDPLKIKDLKEPFNRDKPNEDYVEELHSDDGATGVCQGKKVQIDYMGMMERAFRARNTTPIRSMMHAAGRRRAHGSKDGTHVGVVQQYVQDLLSAGAAE